MLITCLNLCSLFDLIGYQVTMDEDSDYEDIVQNFSEEGGTDSSDDEDVISKKNKSITIKENDSCKGFEEDMYEEFEKRAKNYGVREQIFFQPTSHQKVLKQDDEEISGNRSNTEEHLVTDMDLLYDPLSDSRDEEWVQKHQKQDKYKPKQLNQRQTVNTDAGNSV